MSNPAVETTEPDPAATSLSNDETVNKDAGEQIPIANTEATKRESVNEEAVKEEEVEQEASNDEPVKNEDSKEEAAVKKDSNGTTDTKTTPADGDKHSSPARTRTYENGMLKTSARESPTGKNSKYDPSVLPQTDDPKKIRAQVEFYFGDANLPTDRFMWEMTDGSTNLPISIEKICSFGRMKRFRPISAVVAALRESSFLEVTGPEGQEQVKRKVPYDPSTPRSKAESRSVYVKGFGDEDPSSQFDIEAFFAPFGPTNAVRLRRTPDKLFKGSVFVEFQDDETAQKFLGLDPKPLWKGKHVLKIMSKKEYTDLKEQEIKDGKTEPSESWGPHRGHSRGRGRGSHRGGGRGREDRGRGYDRGDRDPDDWKKRREEDQASGFKDRKGDRQDNRQKNGRGRRDDRGGRNNDRNREREGKNSEKKEIDVKTEARADGEMKVPASGNGASEQVEKKVELKTEVSTDAPSPSAGNEKKRAREDDGEAEETPAKRVDTKTEISA